MFLVSTLSMGTGIDFTDVNEALLATGGGVGSAGGSSAAAASGAANPSSTGCGESWTPDNCPCDAARSSFPFWKTHAMTTLNAITTTNRPTITPKMMAIRLPESSSPSAVSAVDAQ